MMPKKRSKKSASNEETSDYERRKKSFRMAPPPAIDAQYKELLTPIKDVEKSFDIDVSELLVNFISEFMSNRHSANFNRAALIVQSSAIVYGKKVEYLHNLAVQLHHSLQKQQKGEKQQQQQPKKDVKEKEKKIKKLIDPFVSIEIKPGKNLSCLKKKNLLKTKKPNKKVKTSPVPVHLLSNDTDEKGEVFYDTRGEPIGNKGDFAMNKCRITSSGWLLLPTINPKLVPSLQVAPESDEDLNINIGESDGAGDFDNIQTSPGAGDFDDNQATPGAGDFDDIQASPDEGIGDSCPPSSDLPQSTPGPDNIMEEDMESPIVSSSAAPPSTDEGVGSTPNDVMVDSPGAENIPADDDETENANPAPQPIRQSTRQALRTCQLAPEDDPFAGIAISKELLKRKKIENKNCRRMPRKLKHPDECTICPISKYCDQTFFAVDDKGLNKSMMAFDTLCFREKSEFIHRLLNRLEAVKNCKNLLKNMVPIDDSREILEAIECSREANEDDEILNIPFDENEIQIDHDPIKNYPEVPLPTPEGDNVDLPGSDLPSPDISHVAYEENEHYVKEIQKFVNNSDITQRVHEWERSVKPFLDQLEHRESFDINLYGSRILDSFENNNRKQTMTFRQFCKNREKWEIHRYFMALLPLANVGNVSIDSELKEDGTEEIFVTLLSRKMHHTELEEFGHNDGSHS